jgi:hypothetical protein
MQVMLHNLLVVEAVVVVIWVVVAIKAMVVPVLVEYS